MKLKDIKERFNCNACINLAKHYNIHSKTRDGKRSHGLYLGYVSVNNGKATHYPTGTIVSDIDELDRIANESNHSRNELINLILAYGVKNIEIE
jgi:hypothetical protein